MAKEKLTAKSVLTLPEGIYNLERGVYLRVKGQYRSWLFKYSLNGKRCELGLGGIDQSIAGVRAKAAKIKAILAEGKDPRETLRKASVAKPIEATREKATKIPTFREIYQDAVAHYEKMRGWSYSVSRDYEHTAEVIGVASFGNKRIDKITPLDVAKALEPTWNKPSGIRAQFKLGAVFKFAIHKGWITSNPAEWRNCLDAYLPKASVALRNRPDHHHAAVCVDELKNVLSQLSRIDTITARCAMFGILTVCRSQEFRQTKWSEIDWDNATLTVPPERRKDKKRIPFVVPLSRQAMRVLRSIPVTSSDYVFSAQGTGPLCAHTLNLTLKKCSDQEITMHGTRSTFSDWCANNDKPFIVSEKCLMHAVGNQVFMAYQRDDLLEKRRKLLQEWADVLMPISS